MWITGLSFVGFGIWILHPDALIGAPEVRRAGAFVTTLVAFFNS
jgi:putative Ca2+/H+ antiporter (TMEM165/GDT1 family)